MPATPTYALPYPAGTDLVRDGDNVIQALAQRVEALLGQQPNLRNAIRNGDMGISQRSPGLMPVGTPAGTYGLDGWVCNSSGAVIGQLQINQGTNMLPFRFINNVSLTTAASAGSDYAAFVHRIEDVRTFAGQQVTVSFYAQASTAGRTISLSIRQMFGTGGSPSGQVNTFIGKTVVSSSLPLTRYTFTFTVPTIAGMTVGTNENSYLELRFWFAAGATSQIESGLTAGEGTQATFNCAITGVQMEAGPVATPFERLPQQMQLSWCQRYFWRWTASVTNDVFGMGNTPSATQAYIQKDFPVWMRAIPSVWNASAGLTISDRLANYAVTGITMQSMSNSHADMLCGVSGGGMAAHWPVELYSGSTGLYVEFSAEL